MRDFRISREWLFIRTCRRCKEMYIDTRMNINELNKKMIDNIYRHISLSCVKKDDDNESDTIRKVVDEYCDDVLADMNDRTAKEFFNSLKWIILNQNKRDTHEYDDKIIFIRSNLIIPYDELLKYIII
jgi:hypothetical protein